MGFWRIVPADQVFASPRFDVSDVHVYKSGESDFHLAKSNVFVNNFTVSDSRMGIWSVSCHNLSLLHNFLTKSLISPHFVILNEIHKIFLLHNFRIFPFITLRSCHQYNLTLFIIATFKNGIVVGRSAVGGLIYHPSKTVSFGVQQLGNFIYDGRSALFNIHLLHLSGSGSEWEFVTCWQQ
jgi:hypothetical protein